jgi:hypothetical protein
MSQFAEEYHKMNSRYDAATEGRKIKNYQHSNMDIRELCKACGRGLLSDYYPVDVS